jgi:DNA-binding NarL/FixJ family response regulator
MPGGGGADVLKRIKNINPSAKFLISTGSGHDPEVKVLMNLGCQGIIEKPFGWKQCPRRYPRYYVNRRSNQILMPISRQMP